MAPGEYRMYRVGRRGPTILRDVPGNGRSDFHPAAGSGPAAGQVCRRGFFPPGPVPAACLILFTAVALLAGCATSVQAPVVNQDSRVRNRASVSSGESAPARTAGGYHRVRRGDTLYAIAFRYGLDYRELAAWNDISRPYVIYPGQRIRLKPPPGGAPRKPAATRQPRRDSSTAAHNRQSESAVKRTAIKWQWPTSGKLVDSESPVAKKGVDIAGKSGQSIRAAAGGSVVYSGSGLLGYGKLIIIKHNDTFLSAYAHNDQIYVKEGDRVVGGQKIATMGIGNNGEPVLHFEIRENGKPVDPLDHLPEQRS